jgi:hypothetical protein
MHGDYCNKTNQSIKDWLRKENFKPGDSTKCPHCKELVKVPLAANPPHQGVPMPKRRPRLASPEHPVD